MDPTLPNMMAFAVYDVLSSSERLRLRHLQLTHFRAHPASTLAPASHVNLLVGPNGAGKTNLLEAIGYLCLGKSFLASTDQHVVHRGAPYFDVEARFVSDHRPDLTVRLAYVPNEGKRAFVNGAPLDRLADLVGRVPVVILSPADHELTAGGPSERRRFLDATLSQAYPVYLDDLLKYRRALKQRNALLQSARRGRSLAGSTLDAWDEELATLGGRLMDRRQVFLEHFAGFVDAAYELLESPGGEPTLTYTPSVEVDGDAVESLRHALRRSRLRSTQLGRTLVGPHLDEVTFQLEGFDLRPFASQGQHRTFALAVRLAQALYLRDRLDEVPLLLLDDVFGPLDPDRTDLVLALLASGEIGQSFVTAAREEPFIHSVPFEESTHAVFHVKQGAIVPSPVPSPSIDP